MRQMISDELNTLITECDKIIEDTTGRLESQDESQFFQMPSNVSPQAIEEMPEEAKTAVSAKITQEVVNEQILSVCKAASGEDKAAFSECVKRTKAKIMDM